MADTPKVLAQLNPGTTSLTKLYTATGVVTTVSSLFVCNRAATSTTFRISVRIGGAADDPKQYLYYDTAIPANDTFCATVGLTLATTDEVWVVAGATNLSFQMFGIETA